MEDHLLIALLEIEKSPSITKSITDWPWILEAFN